MRRRRSRSQAGLAALSVGLLLGGPVAGPPAARAGDTSELEGTWYVLIHYKNELTANPDRDRWLDLVWVFTARASRLQWTEYPIVTVADPTGRFEGRHRVLAAWEPNDAQWQSISAGPRVNERGSVSKKLRGSDPEGWSSSSRRRAQSFGTIGYEKAWSVEGLPDAPAFLQSDTLSGGGEIEDGGQTRYLVSQKEDGTWRGSYERDGVRHGTFRMVRVASTRGLESEEDEQQEDPGGRAPDVEEDAAHRGDARALFVVEGDLRPEGEIGDVVEGVDQALDEVQ